MKKNISEISENLVHPNFLKSIHHKGIFDNSSVF